jgi:hypothetical protein
VSATPILFVHHAGIDWIRGATRCLLDLLAHIDRQAFRPVVWCNQPTIIAAVEGAGVDVHQAPHWEGGHPLRPSRSWIHDARALVHRYGVRLIHADEFTQASMLLPVARGARIPLLSQLHQVPTADERRWSLLHQVDLAVGTSHACIAGLLEDGYPPERAVVIYNGIDAKRLAQGDASGLRAQLGIPADGVVITVLGSLIDHKAVDVALASFAELRSVRQNCHLLLCGEGPDRAALEQQAHALGLWPSVTFLGERRDAGAVLRDATDILLTTSRDESFGLTLAEAGVFGIPIVASRIAAHREVLGDGEAGVLVAADDVAAFAAALTALVDDGGRRRELGNAAQRRVNRLFLIDRYVRDYQDTYARLIAAPPSRYSWHKALRWPRTYNEWISDAVVRRLTRNRTARYASTAAPSR